MGKKGNGEMKLNRYPKYKPTGIAWLPEVPEGWEVMRLSYLYDIQLGKLLDTKRITGKFLVPYLRNQDVQWGQVNVDNLPEMDIDPEERERFLVRRGDLLVCEGGEIGKSAIWENDFPCYIQKAIMRLRSRDDRIAQVNFMYFIMRCMTGLHVFDNATGKATIAHLPAEKLSRQRIPLPPLPTQRAIVAFLDEKCGKIDRWVAAKEREMALLKELKQAMIAEAVTGATHVARTDTARKMKPSGIPWLPEVPEGWEVKKVRQHFRLRSEKVSEQDYPPLSVAKVGVVPQLADVAISMAQGETRKLVREGDYVVNSRSDRKGSCGIAPQDGSVTTISIVLEPRQIDRQFVHYLFRSTPWVEEFYRNGRGIVADLWTTRYQEMRNMVFPLPPLAEQRAIVAYIEARAAKIDAAVAGLEREVAAMKEYKQRLIADVVTGQRKVA